MTTVSGTLYKASGDTWPNAPIIFEPSAIKVAQDGRIWTKQKVRAMSDKIGFFEAILTKGPYTAYLPDGSQHDIVIESSEPALLSNLINNADLEDSGGFVTRSLDQVADQDPKLGEVTGRLLLPNGQPHPNASIRFTLESTMLYESGEIALFASTEAITGDDGGFTITLLRGGQYKVTFPNGESATILIPDDKESSSLDDLLANSVVSSSNVTLLDEMVRVAIAKILSETPSLNSVESLKLVVQALQIKEKEQDAKVSALENQQGSQASQIVDLQRLIGELQARIASDAGADTDTDGRAPDDSGDTGDSSSSTPTGVTIAISEVRAAMSSGVIAENTDLGTRYIAPHAKSDKAILFDIIIAKNLQRLEIFFLIEKPIVGFPLIGLANPTLNLSAVDTAFNSGEIAYRVRTNTIEHKLYGIGGRWSHEISATKLEPASYMAEFAPAQGGFNVKLSQADGGVVFDAFLENPSTLHHFSPYVVVDSYVDGIWFQSFKVVDL